MKYRPGQVADWFILKTDRDAGDLITHLKVQKLVYYAQAWSLVLLGRPLFEEDIQAWAHGPVVPSLFRALTSNGWQPLESLVDGEFIADQEVIDVLEDVYDVYGEKTAKSLEILTHQEQPWKEARGNCAPEERCENIISKDAMKEFYGKMYSNAEEA